MERSRPALPQPPVTLEEFVHSSARGRLRHSRAVDLPFRHASKRLLAYAAEESEHLDHRHIGTEHLLIALLGEEGTLVSTILSDLGLRVGALRQVYRFKRGQLGGAPMMVDREKTRLLMGCIETRLQPTR